VQSGPSLHHRPEICALQRQAALRRLLIASGIFAAGLLLGISRASAETLTGSARVLDGDTLEIGAERIRLFGIDAPETAQRCRDARGRSWGCGTSSTQRLAFLIGGKLVTCRGDQRDDHGRLLGICTSGGRELNRGLVREGSAWAFVKYSSTYVDDERHARAARRGVFAAENEPPWLFREKKWATAAGGAEADRARACPIKGNISGRNRIYHLPWQRDYGRVRIDERRGERWFCNEGEAEGAGWRRAAR
jgi:endonuclease YncB( thermonuclease family)